MKQKVETAIALAVKPLKELAVNEAEAYAHRVIASVKANLEAAGWDLNLVAPYPNSFGASRQDYMAKKAKHDLYRSLTTWTKPSRSMHEPNIRKEDPEAAARFIQDAKEMAAAQYEAYVAKLDIKRIL